MPQQVHSVAIAEKKIGELATAHFSPEADTWRSRVPKWRRFRWRRRFLSAHQSQRKKRKKRRERERDKSKKKRKKKKEKDKRRFEKVKRTANVVGCTFFLLSLSSFLFGRFLLLFFRSSFIAFHGVDISSYRPCRRCLLAGGVVPLFVFLGFSGVFLVFLGFNGFYRVLPNFTGFYLVLLGFI